MANMHVVKCGGTFCATLLFSVQIRPTSFIRPQHLIIQHLETPFCHIKEGINAKIPFIHAMYI